MKKLVALTLATIMSTGMASSIFAVEREYADLSSMTAEEIQLKKEQVRVPDSINSAISNYVETENDIWSVIVNNLEEDEYGGIYVSDGVLHIKVVGTDSTVNKKIKAISSYVPSKHRSFDNNIVIETDAVYTMAEFDKAIDKLWEAEEDGLIDIVGVGGNDKTNSLFIEALSWDDEKKALVSEITGIDIEHLEFNIGEGYSKDLVGTDIATPGITIENNNTGGKYSLGIGVYYEIDGNTDGD